MAQILLRSAVLGYVMLLWLAVLPVSQLPLLGTAHAQAERLLAAASLRAGMAVFQGRIAADFIPHASCFEVSGYAGGDRRVLYAPECPRRGTIWRRDALEKTIVHMRRGQLRPLLQDPLPPPSRAPELLRSTIELGDYFCHLQADLDKVVMRKVGYARNLVDGSPPAPRDELICTQKCRERYTSPVCSMRRSETLIDALQ